MILQHEAAHPVADRVLGERGVVDVPLEQRGGGVRVGVDRPAQELQVGSVHVRLAFARPRFSLDEKAFRLLGCGCYHPRPTGQPDERSERWQRTPPSRPLVIAGEDVGGDETVEVRSPWDGRLGGLGAVARRRRRPRRGRRRVGRDAARAPRLGARGDPRPRRRRRARPPRDVRADDLRRERQAVQAGARRGGPLRPDPHLLRGRGTVRSPAAASRWRRTPPGPVTSGSRCACPSAWSPRSHRSTSRSRSPRTRSGRRSRRDAAWCSSPPTRRRSPRSSSSARSTAPDSRPPGCPSLVGEPVPIADALIADDRVGLLTFTGSAAIGWELKAKAAKKRVTLELGNSTPVIVCADADLDAAATMSRRQRLRLRRPVVHQRPARDRARERPRGVRRACSPRPRRRSGPGDPADPETDVGPAITPAGARPRGGLDRRGDRRRAPTARRRDVRRRPPQARGARRRRPSTQRVWAKEVFGPVIAHRAVRRRSTRRSTWRTAPSTACRRASSRATCKRAGRDPPPAVRRRHREPGAAVPRGPDALRRHEGSRATRRKDRTTRSAR